MNVNRKDRTPRIAVAGGTGLVGGLVVEALRSARAEPAVIARSAGVNLETGSGLDAALDGVEVVVDVSNVVTRRSRRAIEFFDAATTHLLAAAAAARVRHVVCLSIVGIDDPDLRYGYYVGKRRQEDLIQAGPVPWTILRATQFHEFASQVLDAMGPLVPVPRMLTQPVAAREVAHHLVALAHGEPAGMAPEMAGPRREMMVDMVRAVAQARGRRRLVAPLPIPGPLGRALASGGLLPAAPGPRGVQTFDEWLAGEHR